MTHTNPKSPRSEKSNESILAGVCTKLRLAQWIYPLMGLTFASFVISSQAGILVSAGESVVFNETFADNSNNWSDVSVVNGSGTAATTTGAIDSGEWSPSIIGDNGKVTSNYTLSSDLNIFDGPISLYMRVRQGDMGAKPDGGIFQIKLGESTTNRHFTLAIRPTGSSGFLQYRDTGGQGASATIGGTSFPDTTTYHDFKVMLTPGADLTEGATAEAFRYNTGTSSYDSLGSAIGLVDLDTGIFNTLQITNRNGVDSDMPFDEVVVAVIPEPSTMALLGVFALALVFLNRSQKRHPLT